MPFVAASAPTPSGVQQAGTQAAADAEQAAQEAVQDVTGASGLSPTVPPTVPDNGGDGTSTPPPQSPPPSQPTSPAPAGRVTHAVDRIVSDLPQTADGALQFVDRKAHDAQDQVPDLPTLGLHPHDEASEPAPSQAVPQTAAAVPQGSMLLAGSILVVGATAAATYVVLWLAGSSGTLGAGAATPELRRLLPFASPLFTRFERDTVLGHPRREQLYARILQEPGISLQDLGQATGLSRTAVVHHLRLLEQQHLIISRRVGRSRHYYENGGRYGHDQKEAYAILRNDRSKAVAEFIRSHPGTMQKTLCEALAIPPSIAHWHVRRLQEGGLVESIRQGRAVAYFPGASMNVVSAGPQLEAAPMPTT